MLHHRSVLTQDNIPLHTWYGTYRKSTFFQHLWLRNKAHTHRHIATAHPDDIIMRRTDFSTLSSLYQILQNCQWFSKMLNQEVEQKRFSVMKSNRWRSVFLQQICLDRHWIPNQLDASWNHAWALGSVDTPSRRPFWALSAFYPFLQNLRVTHSSELVLLAPTGTLIVMMVY